MRGEAGERVPSMGVCNGVTDRLPSCNAHPISGTDFAEVFSTTSAIFTGCCLLNAG